MEMHLLAERGLVQLQGSTITRRRMWTNDAIVTDRVDPQQGKSPAP